MTLSARLLDSQAGYDGTDSQVTVSTGDIADGELYVAVMTFDADAAADEAPPDGTWTKQVTNDVPTTFSGHIWTKLAGSSEPATLTFLGDTGAAARISLALLAVSATAGTPTVDTAGGNGGANSGTSLEHPSVAVANNGSLLLSSYGLRGSTGDTVTPPAGQTAVASNVDHLGIVLTVASEQVDSGATGTRAATGSASARWWATGLAIFEASAGVTIQAQPATLTVAAQAMTPALGALTVNAQPATVTVQAQAAAVIPAALTVTAQPATLTIRAQTAQPVVAATPVAIQAQPAVITVTAQPATVVAEGVAAIRVDLSGPATVPISITGPARRRVISGAATRRSVTGAASRRLVTGAAR